MTAQSFGRKGGPGAAGQRRAALVAHQPRSFSPQRETANEDEVAGRRAAFVAEERARATPQAESALPSAEAESALVGFKAEAELVPTDRSLKTAYLIWFFLGLGGGHRFYLRRPLTGAIHALLFLGCLGTVVLFQYYQAFAGLALAWLWYLADGIRLRRLHLRSGLR
jgi:TM2 domain-containing membrane protein YozV